MDQMQIQLQKEKLHLLEFHCLGVSLMQAGHLAGVLRHNRCTTHITLLHLPTFLLSDAVMVRLTATLQKGVQLPMLHEILEMFL
jgi:hypothetical protein